MTPFRLSDEDREEFYKLVKEDKKHKKEMIRRSIQWIKSISMMDIITYPIRAMMELPMILMCAMEMFLDRLLGGEVE